jgi:hypothetical protein
MNIRITYTSLLMRLSSAPTFITCAPNQISAVVRSGLYPWHTLSIISLLPVPPLRKDLGGPLVNSLSTVSVLSHLSAILALHVLNANDAADLVRSFWAAKFTETDVVSLVRGALDLLWPLEPTRALISEEALGVNLAPIIGFLVGLYR